MTERDLSRLDKSYSAKNPYAGPKPSSDIGGYDNYSHYPYSKERVEQMKHRQRVPCVVRFLFAILPQIVFVLAVIAGILWLIGLVW